MTQQFSFCHTHTNLSAINWRYYMNYNFTYGRKDPGLIFILCDLSQKMKRVKKTLETTVRAILEDYINGCICGCQIKDRIHITLIGYGNKVPYIIKKGWANEWVDTLIEVKRNGTSIIKECFENELECESVWEFTKLLLDNQVADIASNSYYTGLCSPIIINITCRKPQDEQLCRRYINVIKEKCVAGYGYSSAAMSREPIKKVFNTTVLNILLLDKYNNHDDVFYPDKKYCSNSKAINFWKENSSECDCNGERLRERGIDVGKKPMMFVAVHNVFTVCFSTIGS